MPFYEYECSSCKFYTELLQKVSDPPLKKCPSCKKTTMKKLVSAPVFRLKGGGWYETDFKSDKEGRRNLALEKEPAANDSSIEAKPDAKPADAKGESKPAESKPAEASAKPEPAAKRRTVAAPAKRVPARSKPRPKPKAPARKKRR